MRNTRQSGRRRAGVRVLAIIALGVAGLAGGAGAQVEGGTLAPGEVGEPKVQALLVTCPPKPPADPCEILTCKGGEWVTSFKASGTSCDDGDPCSVGGTCSGTSVICTPSAYYACPPRGPCESAACNGTGQCLYTAKPAGTVCGYQPGDPTEPSNPCGNTCDGASYLCQP